MIDPATGLDAGTADPSGPRLLLTDQHRALLLGDGGRWTTAAGAAALLVPVLSGIALLSRRQGGLRRLMPPMRGP